MQHLLEVLPELTGHFEVLVVDDGSTDATAELAQELARDYPQIKVARQTTNQGWAATVAKHANQATGDFLMIHCGGPIAADEIVSLWRLRHNIKGANSRDVPPNLANKSLRIDGQSTAGQTSAAKIHLTKLFDGSCIHAQARKSSVLLLKRQHLIRLEKSLAAIPRSNRMEMPQVGPAGAACRQTSSDALKRPSFLSQLQAFTLGQ
jgi:hypothetical protein